MKKAAVLVCMASVLLSGCSGAGGEKVSQTADSCAQAVASELAKTDWTAVSTDANSEDAAYVMAHRDTVALDRLIALHSRPMAGRVRARARSCGAVFWNRRTLFWRIWC